MTEQERFEVYIAKRTLMPANLAKISANSTDYADRTVQMHWLTWQAAQQKEGYVLVPVEPTQEMRGAHYDEMRNQGYRTMDIAAIDEVSLYKAMIAAAQEPT